MLDWRITDTCRIQGRAWAQVHCWYEITVLMVHVWHMKQFCLREQHHMRHLLNVVQAILLHTAATNQFSAESFLTAARAVYQTQLLD